MAGELVVKDWTGDNVALTNFSPNTIVEIDSTNCTNVTTAVRISRSTDEVIGVCYDQSKLDPNGNVVANSGIAVRTWGIAKIQSASAITAGNYVAPSGSVGQVATASHTAGGSQPAPIVGRALNTTTAQGDLVLVLLMIGARY